MKSRPLLTLLAAAVLLFVSLRVYGCTQRSTGAREERSEVRKKSVKQTDQRIKQLVVDSAKAAPKFERLKGNWTAERQQLLDSIAAQQKRIDVLAGVPRETADSVAWVPVEPMVPASGVVRAIEVADSTIRACEVMVINCEARAASYKAQRDTVQAELDDRKRADKLLGLVPLPSRQTSFLLGAGTVVTIAGIVVLIAR